MARTRTAQGWPRLAAGAFAAFVLIAAACGGSGDGGSIKFQDPDDRAVFEVPDDWHLYSADELAAVSFIPFANEGLFPIVAQIGFDGGPGRATTNLTESIAAVGYPVGTYTVRSIGTEARDVVSRGLLQDLVISDNAYQFGQVLLSEDFDFGKDFEGIRRWIPFVDQTTAQTGLVYFMSVTDPADPTVFTMAAGCSDVCWEQYAEEIIGVVDSWIVNTRQ